MSDSVNKAPESPIPFGGAKLLCVLILAAGLFFVLNLWSVLAGLLAAFLVVQGASQFTPRGWMPWLVDYYYRNVRAHILVVYWRDGVAVQKVHLYRSGKRPNLKETRLSDHRPSICVIVSGWRLLFSFWRRAWVEYDSWRRVAHWTITPQWACMIDTSAENARSDWTGRIAPPLKSVLLGEQNGLTGVPLSLEDAVEVMVRLTKLGKGEYSCLPPVYVVGFTPFSEVLSVSLPSYRPASTAKNGDDASASPKPALAAAPADEH